MLKEVYRDVLYLTACAVNDVKPAEQCLAACREEPGRLEELYRSSRAHYLDTLTGMALKETGIPLPARWEETLAKTLRKELLFDTERARILSFMEQTGIWYLPLKGIVLKDFYPKAGTRQMSDNDILFDAMYADKVAEYMHSLGYETISAGRGVHDVYVKPPVYNFEMHRALYGSTGKPGWKEYYDSIKGRLLPTEGTRYGYHMRDEDFYVYIVSHAYKHYSGGGTGLRTLLDFYLFLREKEAEMDFDYVRQECGILGLTGFEESVRGMSRRLFSREAALVYTQNYPEDRLSAQELETLQYYLSSGVYGSFEHEIQNRMNKYRDKDGGFSLGKYYLRRLFPEMKIYQNFFPFFYRHKYLLPVAWLYRLFRLLFVSRRRKKMLWEIHTVQKDRQD